MVVFIVFWAAVLCFVFFILGVVFKCLAAALNGLVESAALILCISLFSVISIVILSALCDLTEEIIRFGFIKAIGRMILTIAVLGVVLGIVFTIGGYVLGIILIAFEFIFGTISFILENISELFEKAYAGSLRIIHKRIERY